MSLDHHVSTVNVLFKLGPATVNVLDSVATEEPHAHRREQQMATSSVGFTPRLRMTRHSPTHDRSAHTVTASTSEAGPSRLPEFSQLVNLTMNDMDVSDNNIYASDVPTPQAPPQMAAKPENPAAVLRALLSRLPNKEGSPTHPDHDTELQYPSERDSDYDVETASATTSVAQSSLKNIFSRALREPGDTPRKDKSHRQRSSSIGDTDLENTPHVLEARDIKGKRRSLSDDEVDNGNVKSVRPRTRFRKTPQPLTQEFLRERFGKFSDSPVKHQDATRDENAASHEVFNPRLDSSQISPPMATSTPQRSLMSFNQSRFNSNLLDKDSEMQNAFDALDSSADNLSNRSISPIPTLQIEFETVEDTTHTKLNEITNPKPHTREVTPQTSLQTTPRSNNKDLNPGVPSTAKTSHSKSTVYDKYDTLGEQSMSLSLPMGHIKLQPDVDHFPNATNGSLSRQHSIASLRPSSPLPDHHRPHTPVDVVHERERNWNKPRPIQHKQSSSHLSHRSSTPSSRSSSPMQYRDQVSGSPVDAQGRGMNGNTSHRTRLGSLSPHHVRNHSFSLSPPPKSPMHRPESPVDPTHERERNWNAPRPRWHDGLLLHTSQESFDASVQNNGRPRTNSLHNLTHESTSNVDGHLHPHRTPPKHTKNPHSRPLSPLPPEKSSPSLTRASSVRTDRDSRPQSTSPSVPVTSNASRRRAKPADKESSSMASVAPKEQTDELLSRKEDHSLHNNVATPYKWPVISSDRQAQPIPNGRIHNDSEAEDVRETDYSSSVDTPKYRSIEPPEVSDEQRHAFENFMVSKAPNGASAMLSTTTYKNQSPPAVQAVSPSTPPNRQSVKLEFKTPSPPKTLPDLPTPSSSDESIDGPLKMAKIPKLGNAHQNKWLQTPKPPGGWLATPQPAKNHEENALDGLETPVPNFIPETPVASESNQFATKTPRPPGGWATPAPHLLKAGESNYSEDKDHRSQLLTPVNSLSRGSALNSKTPGVPGGWVNTPARKSVLKVRFDPQSPEVKEEYVQDSAPESRGEESNPSDLDNPSHAQHLSLPSPRSPRRPKANIRVLDAFGREETPSSSPKKDSIASRNGNRVLDAMGSDIEEGQSEELDKMEESTTPLSRDELLTRLKQGLNELVENIDVVENKEDLFTSDRSRIEELVATSKQARGARERLSSQSKKIVVQPPVVKPSLSWKTLFGLVLAQSLLICVVYRVSLIHSRYFFLTAYYDPFNPERLFNSDGSIRFPQFDALLRDGGAWSSWFDSIDEYLSVLLPMDVMQSNAWTPT